MSIRRAFYVTLFLLSTLVVKAQEVLFPYPDIPDEVEASEARLAYMLNHFWQHYVFADTTATHRQVGEQGMVDFLNLLQHADSLTAAKSAAAWADSLAANTSATPFFIDLMERYLADPESPVHNDLVYAHLLRALPQTPQRIWLLQQVEKNQVGSRAADIIVTLNDGHRRPLRKVEAALTLIVFFDPDCERCHALDVLLSQEPRIQQNPRLTVVRVKADDLHGEYYIPHTPSLYLLDQEKRVLLKDATLADVLRHL